MPLDFGINQQDNINNNTPNLINKDPYDIGMHLYYGEIIMELENRIKLLEEHLDTICKGLKIFNEYDNSILGNSELEEIRNVNDIKYEPGDQFMQRTLLTIVNVKINYYMCTDSLINEQKKLEIVRSIYENRFQNQKEAMDLMNGKLK